VLRVAESDAMEQRRDP